MSLSTKEGLHVEVQTTWEEASRTVARGFGGSCKGAGDDDRNVVYYHSLNSVQGITKNFWFGRSETGPMIIARPRSTESGIRSRHLYCSIASWCGVCDKGFDLNGSRIGSGLKEDAHYLYKISCKSAISKVKTVRHVMVLAVNNLQLCEQRALRGDLGEGGVTVSKKGRVEHSLDIR